MGNSHEFHNMSLFLWQWGVNCAVLPYVYSLYKNSENQTLAFQQTVKSKFHPHINTEGYDLQETKVNSCNAIYIEYINAYGVSSTVIWDNEDYILELFGDFDNNELRDLAISNEINGF